MPTSLQTTILYMRKVTDLTLSSSGTSAIVIVFNLGCAYNRRTIEVMKEITA